MNLVFSSESKFFFKHTFVFGKVVNILLPQLQIPRGSHEEV